MKFILLAGIHSDKTGRVWQAKSPKNPNADDIVESDKDLVKEFNVPGFAPKFQYFDQRGTYQNQPQTPPELTFENLSIPVLKAYALDLKINLKGKETKEEIIATIRAEKEKVKS